MKDVDVNEQSGFDQAARYRIKVQGRLDEGWSDWFSGMTVTFGGASDDAATTTLTGVVADQAALRGVLSRLWDLNLTLISVERIEVSSK